MQVRLFLLCILFFLTTSFFWDDEEKQLRQLHQNGEAAMQKQEFEEAKTLFEELLNKVSVSSSQKYRVDWATYVDVHLRLAEAYEEISETENALKTIDLLLIKNPPEELIPRIKLMRARLLTSPATAFQEMKMVATHYPVGEWNKKDLSFYRALQHSLNSINDSKMQKAKRFLATGFYKEAIVLYEEILAAIKEGSYPKVLDPTSLIEKKIRYRLAESYFLAADYEQTLALCNNGGRDDRIDREMIYLSALCHREKQEYEKALELFQTYAQSAEQEKLAHFEHALFEIGLFYFQHGNVNKAVEYFEKLQHAHGKLRTLGAIYLAKIYLAEDRAQEVEELLLPITNSLESQDLLRYECCFLRGSAAYALGEFLRAKDLFEQALPEKRVGEWYKQALYRLGWCYIRIGDDFSKTEEWRNRFFNKAEKIFTALLSSEECEKAALTLSRLYLLRNTHFGEEKMRLKVEAQLKEHAPLFSFEGQIDALLLRAEAAQTYQEKEMFYLEATRPQFRQTPSYPQAWYARGLNHFQEGLKQRDTHYFDLATTSFEQAFKLMEKGERDKCATILKLEAKANLYRNSPITSLALLEKLLTQFSETVEEREETLYLRGLIASRLTDFSYFPIAEESLKQVIESYPNGKYPSDALHVLATLYFGSENYVKAKQTYLQLAKEYPNSPYAPTAWFWAAEAAEKLKENPHEMRKHVYEDYPSCDLAAEAYFRQFSYSDYLSGEAPALKHLKEFQNSFHKSPLLIVVHYLLGMNEKNLETARMCFEKGLESFSQYLKEAKVPDSAYVFVHYQTLLELASRLLSSRKDLEKCEELLVTLVNDFSKKEDPLTSPFKQKTPYPSLFEQGEYTLVQCYIKQGRLLRAQKLLSTMFSHFSEAGVSEGYYLSLAWLEEGRLAIRCADYESALNCLELANESGKGYLSDDEQLSLWILQSNCFKEKKEYDTAMRLLSKVINAETASPLRLEAMYLRAEIYDLQGRPELALRQLEAATKKGDRKQTRLEYE